MYSKEQVEKANIELSKELADKYNETEPHYKSENKAIVRTKLQELQQKTSGTSLLDLGCGTGFIIDIAKEYFTTIYGIDLSGEMMERVNRSCKENQSIVLSNRSSENTNYGESCFDVVTAYSLLHHLHDIEPTVREAYRVLKPGGVFWSALDPNFYFWEAICNLDEQYEDLHSMVTREYEEIRSKQDDLLFRKAEPLKYQQGGFKEEYLYGVFFRAGFKEVNVDYYWFLGERTWTREENIKYYLQSCLPLSKHLFKYLSIEAVK